MNKTLYGVVGTLSMLAVPLIAPAVTPLAAQHGVASTTAPASVTEEAVALLAKPVTVRVDAMTLRAAVNAIAAAAHVGLQYRSRVLDAYSTTVTLRLTNVPLGQALSHALAGTSLHVVPRAAGFIGIVTDEALPASVIAFGTITGTVVDANTKRPLGGATVTLDNATKGVATAENGEFRLSGIDAGAHRVTVRLLGHARQTKTVEVADGQAVTVGFALDTKTNTLDQVVVTGTVIPTEIRAVPNAITIITAKDIEERGITHVDQLFRGDVPGLFAPHQGSAVPLDEVTMFSRGATALSTASSGTSILPNGTTAYTNPIKTYIDGIELADSKYLSQIDPKSIERIEILTGPQASTIYGSNAINGVMQIFTKRGTTSHPQLIVSLLSGFVQNDFSSALAPQHDVGAQVNGVEGALSYNAGGSWNYLGAWNPSNQPARTGAFGGARLGLPTPLGQVTADMTLRRSITQNRRRGSPTETWTSYQETGWWIPGYYGPTGIPAPETTRLAGQTLGFVLGYAPTSWWSHELGVGVDNSDTELRRAMAPYQAPFDSTLFISQTHTDRRSLRYSTTARVPVTSLAQLTVTTGADAWQNVSSFVSVFAQTLTGTLTGRTRVSRQPGHNTGGFVQTQLGVKDRLFFTYGLRAEWNPGYGEEAQPNYAPRYGIAYTYEIGPVTTKLRGSYGRSTRPPQQGLKAALGVAEAGFYPPIIPRIVTQFGSFDRYLANPELSPEHQQGGEGGLELYLGTRGSLVITRYNQTVDGLIANPVVDSVRSFAPNPFFSNSRDIDGYGYLWQYKYVNVGSIRNQGWELQGSMNLGPLTTHGTYSWTKSRTIGVNPKYRSFFTAGSYPQYQPGATFQFLPEHTWALGVTYARSATTVGLNVTGTGRIRNENNALYFRSLDPGIRLDANRLNIDNFPAYINFNSGYALADLNASHRFFPRVEGILQVQNLMDRYTNDYRADYASIGRQIMAGLRVRTN